MKSVDGEHHHTSGTDHRWASFWEYGLIVAGLALVIVFGTHSLSRNMKDSAARSTLDPTTTASIASKKIPAVSPEAGGSQTARP